MKYLFEDWHRIKKNLNNKFIALFLDYDGTISPIVDKPEEAFIPKETKQLLWKLSKNPNCTLAIISGRALKDIKRKVAIDRIIYVGNHGLEIEGPKIKFESPVSVRYKGILQHIKDDLNTKLAVIIGAFVEDKGLSLSVHYRLADRDSVHLIKDIFTKIIQPYLTKGEIKLSSGKKVFEIRPAVEWDKGKIVLWLLARQHFALKDKEIFPIYIGDDVTDEDAFKVLRNKGLNIFVGRPKKSYAKYYLKNTKEVFKFLKRISTLKFN